MFVPEILVLMRMLVSCLFPHPRQRETLGGRENGRERELGSLKWGVGKLVAHAPKRPIVVPFFHMGMESVMPQDPVSRRVLTTLPRPGHNVRVLFGEAITFDDLIEEHEARHGKLWKYRASVLRNESGNDPGEDSDRWVSRDVDYELYHKIALRIEGSLRALNTQYLRERELALA